MEQSPAVFGIILARSGSKRVPGKNVRLLCGKPLIAWTIEAALDSGVCDRLIVSTDSAEIAEVANAWGAEVPGLRPEELARDSVPSRPVVADALHRWGQGEQALLLLQPTCPLRTAEDIRNAYDVFQKHGCRAAVRTMTEAPCPKEWIVELEDDCRIPAPGGWAETLTQDFPRRFIPNGAVCFAAIDYFHAHGLFGPRCYASIMPPERSVDIDTELDFAFAEFLAGRRL